MELKDVAAWVGIFVSLYWNYVNSNTANSNWVRGQRLTDFRKIREPIDAELAQLGAMKIKIRSLQAFGGSDQKFLSEFKAINKDLVEVNVGLQQKIEVADRASCFSGDQLGQCIERKWDDLTTLINNVYTNSPAAQRLNSISVLVKGIDDYISYISQELDTELDGYLVSKNFNFKKHIIILFLALLIVVLFII